MNEDKGITINVKGVPYSVIPDAIDVKFTRLLGIEQLQAIKSKPIFPAQDAEPIIFARVKDGKLKPKCPRCGGGHPCEVHKKNIPFSFYTIVEDAEENEYVQKVVLLATYYRCPITNGVYRQCVLPCDNDADVYVTGNKEYDIVMQGKTKSTIYGARFGEKIGRACLTKTFARVARELNEATAAHNRKGSIGQVVSPRMVADAFRVWTRYMDNYRLRAIQSHGDYEQIWIQTLTVHQGTPKEESAWVIFDVAANEILWIAEKKQAQGEPADYSGLFSFLVGNGTQSPFGKANIYMDYDEVLCKWIKEHLPYAQIVVPLDYLILRMGKMVGDVLQHLPDSNLSPTALHNISERTCVIPDYLIDGRKDIWRILGFLPANSKRTISAKWKKLKDKYQSSENTSNMLIKAEKMYRLKEKLSSAYYCNDVVKIQTTYNQIVQLVQTEPLFAGLEDILLQTQPVVEDIDNPTMASNPKYYIGLHFLAYYMGKDYGCKFDATRARILYCGVLGDVETTVSYDTPDYNADGGIQNTRANTVTLHFNVAPEDLHGDGVGDIPTEVQLITPRRLTLGETIVQLQKIEAQKKV